MSEFQQPLWPAGRLPLVYEEGVLNFSYPVSLLACDGSADLGNITLQVIQIAEFEGQLLVAVPYGAWNRQIAKRVLPAGALTKYTLVEVISATSDNLLESYPEVSLKLWIGFLEQELAENLEVLEEYSADYYFDKDAARPQDVRLLPFAEALMSVSQEHFAFFSAEEEGGGKPDMDDEVADAGLDGEPMTDQEVRMAKLETALMSLTEEVKKLAASPISTSPATKAKAATKKPNAKSALSLQPSRQLHLD